MAGDDFNKPLWEEKFLNIINNIDSVKDDVGEIKDTVNNLVKLSVGAIVAVCGWSLVQLYGNVNNKADAAPIPIEHHVQHK